jgi:Fe2+ transport system protein FeoA
MTRFTPGSTLRVKSVDYKSSASKMLVDMGITPGTVIHVEGTAPLGEPVVIRVRDYKLAVRAKDLGALSFDTDSGGMR